MSTILRAERIKRGMTQLTLAEKTGVSNVRLCLAEKGYQLKPDEIQKVSRVLKVDPKKLLLKV
jgi:transcriptional regulator with XRE-family HTH domain